MNGSRIARAQTTLRGRYKITVGYGAGGPNDIVARLIAQSLSERIGQQFVVENRFGAASNVGTEVVVNSTPEVTS